jgi:hypothetical protein
VTREWDLTCGVYCLGLRFPYREGVKPVADGRRRAANRAQPEDAERKIVEISIDGKQ